MSVPRFFTFAKAFLCVLGSAVSAQAQDLIPAARNGDLDALRAALAAKEAVEPGALELPLFFAAQKGHLDAVSLLLDRGGLPNAVTRFGTPLQIASRNGHLEIVATLIEAGADPMMADVDHGHTPLHHAAERGMLDTARALVDAGADVNARSSGGIPPIHLAATRRKSQMVDFLREQGAAPIPVVPVTEEALANADLELGRRASLECRVCHELATDQETFTNFPGPTLIGVLDRTKASVVGYPYSPAMQAQTGSWTVNELNRFLGDPTGVVPGTDMNRGGEADWATRVSLIAYLATLERE